MLSVILHCRELYRDNAGVQSLNAVMTFCHQCYCSRTLPNPFGKSGAACWASAHEARHHPFEGQPLHDDRENNDGIGDGEDRLLRFSGG